MTIFLMFNQQEKRVSKREEGREKELCDIELKTVYVQAILRIRTYLRRGRSMRNMLVLTSNNSQRPYFHVPNQGQ